MCVCVCVCDRDCVCVCVCVCVSCCRGKNKWASKLAPSIHVMFLASRCTDVRNTQHTVFALGNFQPRRRLLLNIMQDKWAARTFAQRCPAHWALFSGPALFIFYYFNLSLSFSLSLVLARMRLTVLVLIVCTAYPAVREHLQVKPNAHVAVQSSHSFDALQIVTLPVQLRFPPAYPQIGAGEQRLPLLLQQSRISPARERVRRGDPPQRSPQYNHCRQRPVRPGHAVEAPLRNGHPVHLWGTWSKLPALEMQLFWCVVLWHGGGKGLFRDQGRSRPHSPRCEQRRRRQQQQEVEERDGARRSLNWCRWRWSSFAAPRLCTGNAGRGGEHHSPQNQLTLPDSHILKNDITVTSPLHPPIKSRRWEEEEEV